MKKYYYTLISLLLFLYSNATIINVPKDQPTIQAGVNVAIDGDTVLVQPGIFVENINYNGKNITVASLFLTTQDTSYISQTIIDGDSITSVVFFDNGEDSTAVLCGFTIRNGLGGIFYPGGGTEPEFHGGGITCRHWSSPIIRNIVIAENSSTYAGGGIYCKDSHPYLTNITIKENYSNGWDGGGGIYCRQASIDLQNVTITGNTSYLGGGICGWWGCNINLQNVTITNNSANTGGGIYCKNSTVYLQNSTIKHNSASSGGGVLCEGSTLVFDSTDRCNIYSNTTYWRGNDLYSDIYNNIILDTFSVLYPTHFYAEPMENFSFDILNGKIEQIDADVYVSPSGDNTNNGLTSDEPFKTIHFAFSKIRADSLNQNTIHLLEGTYGPSNNEEPLPILMLDYLSLRGEIETGAILDAEEQSEVLIIDSNTEAHIMNLTIEGGNGRGISIKNCNPDLQDLTVTNNAGCGIYCYYSNPEIENATVTNNTNSGIICDNSNPVLKDVYITGNSADYGAGIYCASSNPDMTNVIITGNTSVYEGGGMYLNESNPVFNSTNRCNIYLNNDYNSKGLGADIFSFHSNMIHVVVDTFTVMTPTDYYASPIDKFTFDIIHSIHDNLVNSDLFVSVNGDNSNAGTSPDDPFKTINYALSRLYSDSLNHHIIYLLPGTYSQATNGERYPISWSSHVSLQGSVEGVSILDANGLNGVLRFLFVTNSTISHLTIKNGHAREGGGIYCYESNPVFNYITISDNYAGNGGGGIYCYKSNPVFNYITITENYGNGINCHKSNPILENIFITGNNGSGIALDESNPQVKNTTINGNTGSGIACSESSPRLTNVYITDNDSGGLSCSFYSTPILENVIISENSGPGISCENLCNLLLKNVTVSNNTAIDGCGGLYLSYQTSASLINCIFWNNSLHNICVYDFWFLSEITISWSDIEGGQEGIVHNQSGTVNWLNGNLDENPLFTGTGDHPYALSAASLCIDAGTPDTTGLFLPPYDIIGNPRIWNERIDMGAYEWNNLGFEYPAISNEKLVINIYPNPFSISTTIEYELSEPGTAEIKIYNQTGQLIEQIVQEDCQKGKNKFIWLAKDAPPGIYFIRLQIDNEILIKKIIKL